MGEIIDLQLIFFVAFNYKIYTLLLFNFHMLHEQESSDNNRFKTHHNNYIIFIIYYILFFMIIKIYQIKRQGTKLSEDVDKASLFSFTLWGPSTDRGLTPFEGFV